jgi:hypothetical protein
MDKNTNIKNIGKQPEQTIQNDIELLNTRKLASIMGLHYKTIESWRNKKIGPNYIKIGKSFYYTKKDVYEFLKNNKEKGEE